MLFLLAAAGTVPSTATAQGNPNKAAARCRKVIATATTQLIATGLNTISACHRKRNKGKSTGDCNVLAATPSTNFGRARNRAAAQIGAACKPDNPVLQNYPNSDVVNSLFPEVQRRLEGSGTELQGLPDLVGDKPKGKCHASIGSARNGVMLEITRKSASCQKRLDKQATEFGALAAQCVVSPSKSASKASKLLGKCTGITGAEVGSCGSLPGCVVEESTSFGRGLAALIYGGPTVCGNGVIEGFEVCDDGNADDTDACTADCQDAVCGDGVVQAGVEQCDDGNDEPDDSCDNCQNPVCGDGRVAVGAEECDDGNTTPNDGCSECVIDPVICGTSGVLATVVLDYDPAVLGEIAGMFLQLGYPTFLSIPGSLNAGSVTARVSDLTGAGAFFFPVDRDTNSDGTDDQLRTNYLIDPGTVPPGDFERVLFDCVPGTGVRPADFACSLADVVDPFTNLYPQATIDQLTSCFVSILEAPGGGGTTTTTAPPTSSTVATTSTTSSTTTTISITCGNGTPEGAEQCDDGNENPSDGCTNACTACGNSTTTAPETCDDGDLDDGDGCDSNCTVTACGNGLVVGSETCDDGNTSNNDSCPADCIVDNCTPLGGTDRQVSVTFSGSNVAGLTVLLDYPEGKVSIPGSGSGVPAGIITDNPGGSFANANDLDHALRELVAAGGAITPGLLFRVHFEDCQGASAPSAGEFTCTVVSASDPDSQPVGGVTCAVTIP